MKLPQVLLNAPKAKIILWAVIGLCIAGAGYGVYCSLTSYRRTVSSLRGALDQNSKTLLDTRTDLELQIADLKDTISSLKGFNAAVTDTLLTEQQRNSSVERQIGQVSTTVGTLQKLSQTDPELLKKYSKVYFLNEHYVPLSLASINTLYLNDPARKLQIHSSVDPHLEALLAAAASAGLTLQIDSAYRSFGTQAVLKASYRLLYGAGTANQFSAEQGYSEHQLGTAVDFTTKNIGGGLNGFDSTPEYTWLLNNAYKYGFVISYPKDNTSYEFEPWHWRYVGVSLATTLHSRNENFYAMDQREIDTYLATIFD